MLYPESIVSDLSFELPFGTLSGQRFQRNKHANNKELVPVLALHGWLDNSSSFGKLAPLLPLEKIDLLAIDLPGHGLSEHRPAYYPVHLLDPIFEILCLLDHLGWKKVFILGHSLGASLAVLLASSFPERILGLALLDGLGPLSSKASDAPEDLYRGLNSYLRTKPKRLPLYASFEEALASRAAAGPIEASALTDMVHRGLMKTPEGFSWRTDPRLTNPLVFRYTEEQILAFIRKISVPSCLVRAHNGYDFGTEIFQTRKDSFTGLEYFEVEGGHHVHLENPEIVAPIINKFFEQVIYTRYLSICRFFKYSI
jgi:pimeloyl-ACP methyl ester carboxylesterase